MRPNLSSHIASSVTLAMALAPLLWLRSAAAEELARTPEATRAVHLLAAADLFSQKAGLLELEALREPGTLDAVQPFLDHRNPELRAQALTVARAIQQRAALPLLLDRLALDRDERVRRQAANELRRLADPSTVPALTAALRDRSLTVRIAAVEALGAIKDRSVTTEILRQMRSRHAELRRSAVEALGALRDPAAQPLVAQRTRDRDVNVRRAAVKALGRYKDRGAMPVFIRTLRDRDDTVRQLAMKALAPLLDHDALPQLRRLARAGRPMLRLYGIALLERLGTPEALAALQERRASEWNDTLRRALDGAIRAVAQHQTAAPPVLQPAEAPSP